jgi:voltage-gated sodium channel
MPIQRRPTPPPETLKQQLTVLDSLNAWTDPEEPADAEASKKAKHKPLGATPLRGEAEGWRVVFDAESDNFNAFIGFVIVANAIVIGLETDLGHDRFTIAEHIFCSIFFLEMMTRIAQLGIEYFQEPWYLFDFTLVLTASLDLWIIPLFLGDSKEMVGYQFSVMRLLRMLRLLRVLRVIRVFRMFHHLLLIVKAFGKAIQVVLLISVIIVIMIYAFAIVITQLVGHQSHKWGDKKEDIEQWFGSIPTSMSTLFWVMFGSGWDPLQELLTMVYPVGLVLAFFAGYMVITVSLISLIVGLISESLIMAQEDFKLRKLASFAQKKKVVASDLNQELKELLDDDVDEKGTIEGPVLKQTLKADATLGKKLADVGVSLTAEGLQNLVDSMTKDGTERVGLDHFIEKLINLSGHSQASAVVDVKHEIYKNRQKLKDLEKKLETILEKAK